MLEVLTNAEALKKQRDDKKEMAIGPGMTISQMSNTFEQDSLTA